MNPLAVTRMVAVTTSKIAMKHSEHCRRPAYVGIACVLGLALMSAGCSTDRIFGSSNAPPTTASSSSSSPSFGDRLSSLFGKRPDAAQPAASGQVAAPTPDFDCPTVEIRSGASTYSVSTPGVDPSALTLRYQATIAQTARECKLIGRTTVSMRVGVEGRIIVGPAGGPGQVDVPLRIAVVQEGPEPKTIMTKLHWVSVTMPPDELHVPFVEVDEDVSFPLPRGDAIDAYVVYVGFDRGVVKEPERPVKKPPAKKPPVLRRTG